MPNKQLKKIKGFQSTRELKDLKLRVKSCMVFQFSDKDMTVWFMVFY